VPLRQTYVTQDPLGSWRSSCAYIDEPQSGHRFPLAIVIFSPVSAVGLFVYSITARRGWNPDFLQFASAFTFNVNSVKLEYRHGRLLVQRVGPINPTRQRELTLDRVGGSVEVVGRRNPRAPERKGIWVFPFPMMDLYFACYQRGIAMPKRLSTARREVLSTREAGAVEDEALWQRLDAIDDEFEVWSKTEAGRSRLRVRKFWVSGIVWTHLQGPNGVAVGDRWLPPARAVPVGEFVELARRSRSGSDSFELFLGRGAKIH